uniref:Uncharacterized protein n=1 Tax=Anguilla anguilla TaxID=7936 RepID=A0A0E9P8J4_ANGAN
MLIFKAFVTSSYFLLNDLNTLNNITYLYYVMHYIF